MNNDDHSRLAKRLDAALAIMRQEIATGKLTCVTTDGRRYTVSLPSSSKLPTVEERDSAFLRALGIRP